MFLAEKKEFFLGSRVCRSCGDPAVRFAAPNWYCTECYLEKNFGKISVEPANLRLFGGREGLTGRQSAKLHLTNS